MGADLVSYIAFGPEHIDVDEQKRTEIARAVRECLDACITAAELFLTGRRDVPDPCPQPGDAKCSTTLRFNNPPEFPTFKSVEELRGHKDYRGLVEQVLDACGNSEVTEYVFSATLDDLAGMVQNFVESWNKPCYRDMAVRQDPDDPNRKVVVAGELSWGSEPDGAGYQLLKRAFDLNIAQMLGAK
jgi:hypothetical protein